MMVGRNSDIKEIVKWIQEHVYAMLCDIDDFCKKNNITYFLQHLSHLHPPENTRPACPLCSRLIYFSLSALPC